MKLLVSAFVAQTGVDAGRKDNGPVVMAYDACDPLPEETRRGR